PFIAVAHGGGLNSLEVRSCGWFGHGDRCDDVAADHAWKPAMLLFFAAVLDEVGRNNIGVDRESGSAGASASLRFGGTGVEKKICTCAAVCFGNRRAQ